MLRPTEERAEQQRSLLDPLLLRKGTRSWQAGLLAFVIALMGFAGGLVMSAIKRDRGIKDFGAVIEGHGGILDRIDSICFAAPVFFHLTRSVIGP